MQMYRFLFVTNIINQLNSSKSFTHIGGSRRVLRVGLSPAFVCVSVCLFIRTISQKPMQLGSSNLIHNCSMMSLGKHLCLGSNGHRSRSRVTKIHCRRGSLHSCECRLLIDKECCISQRAQQQPHKNYKSVIVLNKFNAQPCSARARTR